MSDDKDEVKHLSVKERLWRWAGSSGSATLVQILLALVFSYSNMSVFWAGTLAVALSGWVAFYLHTVYTWRDRHRNMHGRALWLTVAKRFVLFELVSLSAAIINGSIQWTVMNHLTGLGLLVWLTDHTIVDFRVSAWLAANAVSAPYGIFMLEKVVFRHDEPPNDLVEGDE